MTTTQTDSQIQIRHRFDVIADPEGGYVIEYPDLPGCITQVESIDEVGAAAQEIHDLWLEAALENATPIPVPTNAESFSGKFLLRVPKSLHRRLVERARSEGVSLNQLAQSMLAESIGRITAIDQFDRRESRSIAENPASYPANSTDPEK